MARVLVVISDWEARLTCRDALVSAGHLVVTAANVEGADYMLRSSSPPDVAVFSMAESLLPSLEAASHDIRFPAMVVLEMDEAHVHNLGAHAVAMVRRAVGGRTSA
jgi:CheY-like chemotaxis protein